MGCATSQTDPLDAGCISTSVVVPSSPVRHDGVARDEVECLRRMLAQEKDEKRWLMTRFENLEADLSESRSEMSRLEAQIADARSRMLTTPKSKVAPAAWAEAAVRVESALLGKPTVAWPEFRTAEDLAAIPDPSHCAEPSAERADAEGDVVADGSEFNRVRLGACKDRLRAGSRGKPGVNLGLVTPKPADDAALEQPMPVRHSDPDQVPLCDGVPAREPRGRFHTWAGTSSPLLERRGAGSRIGRDGAAAGRLGIQVKKVCSQEDLGPMSPKRVQGRRRTRGNDFDT